MASKNGPVRVKQNSPEPLDGVMAVLFKVSSRSERPPRRESAGQPAPRPISPLQLPLLQPCRSAQGIQGAIHVP